MTSSFDLNFYSEGGPIRRGELQRLTGTREDAGAERNAHAYALAFPHALAAHGHHPLAGRDRGAAERAQRRAHRDQL